MRKVKYIIVGQGLAGIQLSYQFVKNNVEHIVISSPNRGMASMVAAGMYNPLVFKRITKSWMADQLLPEMMQVYSELEQLLNIKILHEKPIAKLINAEEKDWWFERIESQKLDSYIKGFLEVESIIGVKANFESVIIRSAGFVNLQLLVNTYRKFLVEQNMFIESEFNIADLKLTGRGIEWGNIKAETIIFCEGSAAINNPFFSDVKFHLTRGDLLEIEIIGLSEEYIINKNIFLLPIGNNVYKLGSTYDHSNLSWNPDLKAAQTLIEKAEELVQLPIKLLNNIAGVRPTVSDRRPVLGIHPDYSQIAMFNGLGTKGVMLAPYFAKEMYNLLLLDAYKVDKEVSIRRFLKR